MRVSGNDKIAKDICDALGLKHVRALDIHVSVDELFTVTAKFYPDKDGVKQFPLMFQKFELVAKGEPKECPVAIETTCVGEGVANYDFKVVK